MVYHVTLLSVNEAIILFNRHAYNENERVENYETLSLRVVSYAVGLPLGLKVLGSFLYNKGKKGWMSTLDRLNDIPEIEIVEKLRISYDGLKTVEKELFLDIACFWRGRRKDYAMEILEACGYHPEKGVEVLRQKALITVSQYGRFDMHDLVQEMGHYIVRGEHPNNPEKHSRVWNNDEINNMVVGDSTMENDKIEALEYYHSEYHRHVSQFCESVSNMTKLRYLRVWMSHGVYAEGLNFLSNELRYIEWEGYPTRSSFRDSFQPMKLVALKLHWSMQKHLWNCYKHLPQLKVLQLEYMEKLLRTPDFDGLPCLQKLTIEDCKELEAIHPSLGNHKSLEYVSVWVCKKLEVFPTVVHMESLKILEIMFCRRILEFPKIQTYMESLVTLSLGQIGIEVLPSSIGKHCTNLTSLNLSYLDNLKSIEFNFDVFKLLNDFKMEGFKQVERKRPQLFHQFLRRLWKLDPSAYRLKDVKVLSGIAELSNLQELNLSDNDFSRLDFSLVQLPQLKLLNLSGFRKLLELSDPPSSLAILNANNCKSLTTFGDCHKYCRRLCQVSIIEGSIIDDGDRFLESMLEICRGRSNIHNMLLHLQGFNVAKGFVPFLRDGSRCRLQLPENRRDDFSGFLMCVVFTRDYAMVIM